jgi:exopolyphosphatase / guanosine-5'-triphosphate,3'-diphosphate pyrophosphatase
MTAGAPVGAGTPPPAGTVPRWEWRTFGGSFGAADELLGGREPELVQESDEVYLLSLESDASVKVRDGAIDVKQLEHVNADGLEQWRPVLKAPFPLAAPDVASLLTALGVEAPPLARETYTLAELLDEIVHPHEALQAVDVHKHREHHRPGGCPAEVTRFFTTAASTRTIAVESEDPALVAATVRSLGLESRPNVCVARGLKTLVGFDAVRYAVIDVGTNSVKCHLGEHRPGGVWRTIIDRAEVTRLGEGLLESGRLDAGAIERTVAVIAQMADEVRRHGAVAIAAVGTAGLRTAENAGTLVDAVQARCGVGIDVISGEEESRLAYAAATSGLELGQGSLVVFDTGGGSSQFTFGHGARVDERFSVPVGAVRFTERYGLADAVSRERLEEALAAIAAELEQLDGRSKPDALVAAGGAVTNLAAVKLELASYDPDVVQATVLDRVEIDRQIELYRARSAEARRRIVGLQPGRAEVILAGACIVRTVLEKLGCESLTVSDRGLRHGLLVERFGEARVNRGKEKGDGSQQ